MEKSKIGQKEALNREQVGALESQANRIIKHEFENIGDDHLINKLSRNSDLYKNSIVLSIGNRGTSKTTHFMKEMIKLSLDNCWSVHLIIYCTNNENDIIFHKLMKHVTIPIIKIKYENLNTVINDLVGAKDMYLNSANLSDKSSDLNSLFTLLRVKDLDHPLQTIIFCDDAAHIFNSNNKNMTKHLASARHHRCSYFICLQTWKMIAPEIKSMLTLVYLGGGFNNRDLRYIYSQLPI